MFLCRREARARRKRSEEALSLEEAASAAQGLWSLGNLPRPIAVPRDAEPVPNNAFSRPLPSEADGVASEAEDSGFRVKGVAAFRSSLPLEHIAERVQLLTETLKAGKASQDGIPQFLLLVWTHRSFWSGVNTAVVQVFERQEHNVSEDVKQELGLFFGGGEEILKERLVSAAYVRETNTIVKNTIVALRGERPVHIARRLSTKLFKGGNYLEVNLAVDSTFGSNLVRAAVLNASSAVELDTSFLIEKSDKSMGFILVGTLRWHYVDVPDVMIDLDDNYTPIGVFDHVQGDGDPLPSDMPGDAWHVHIPEFFVDANPAPTTGGNLYINKDSPKNTYSNPDVSDFIVRGPGYLDGHKVVDRSLKLSSQPSLYKIAGANCFRTKADVKHIVDKVDSLKSFLCQFSDLEGSDLAEFPMFMVLCWVFRSAWSGENTAVVHVFRRDDEEIRKMTPGIRRALKAFVNGNTKARVDRLKLIAKIRDAPAAVKRTVLSLNIERPVLIARKLTTHFFDGPNYIEIDQDVGSSTTASMLNSTVQRASGAMMIDKAWLIEAKHEDELPEQLLCAVRFNYVGFNEVCFPLDSNYQPMEIPEKKEKRRKGKKGKKETKQTVSSSNPISE